MMYIRMIILGAIAAGLAAGYLYVKDLQRDLDIAQENVSRLEIAVQTSEQSLAVMLDQAERFTELNDELTSSLRQSEEYGDRLRATLRKHDLTNLAERKPGLIQNRMQDATDKVWDDITAITTDDGMQSTNP